MEKFINHSDPTADITEELKSVSLEKQYTQLTDREKLLIFCKLNGYSMIPPSIERLYSDTYYLGGEDFFDGGKTLFDYWKTALPKIFPSEVLTAKPYLILSGAIGIGKSTVSRLCLAMAYARLLCMRNPSVTLGLTPKPLSAVIMHRSEETADIEFRRWFKYDVLQKSPFFRDTHNDNLKFKIITSGPRGSAGLGSDVIFYLIGEVNFWDNQENAQSKVATALGRFTSRFDKRITSLVGNFIIDSSAKGSSSTSEWFLDNTDPGQTWNCCPTHWDVRKSMYAEDNGRTFPVYCGDGKYPPQILPEDYVLGVDQDPGRVLNVPVSLRQEAVIDLHKMLMDKGGISLANSDSFFGGSIEHLVKCSSIKNRIPEVVTVDFYNKQDRLFDKVWPMINLLPIKSPVWIGLDLATKSDMAGLAAVTFDGWEVIGKVKLPRVRTLFVIAVGRKDGQQTSLFHFEDLIFEMHKKYNITVSADFAFSSQLLQDCEREGIKTRYISTDNTPSEPAMYLKNIINNELIKLPENKRLQREAYDLKYSHTNTGKIKIDHPKRATQNPKVFDVNNGVGSKDTWDALASAVYSLKMSIDEGDEYGFNGGYYKQLQAMNSLTKSSQEETTKRFQGMIENIF